MLESNHIRLAGVHSMLRVVIRRIVTILPAKRIDQRQTQARVSSPKLRKCRRTMRSLQTVIKKEAKELDMDFICEHIRDLLKILTAVQENEGGRTEY